MKGYRTESSSRPKRRPRRIDRLEVGQKIRDRSDSKIGVVLDSACQYSHPKADPVFSYLVRWDDGQVQAISEAALGGSYGLTAID